MPQHPSLFSFPHIPFLVIISPSFSSFLSTSSPISSHFLILWYKKMSLGILIVMCMKYKYMLLCLLVCLKSSVILEMFEA